MRFLDPKHCNFRGPHSSYNYLLLQTFSLDAANAQHQMLSFIWSLLALTLAARMGCSATARAPRVLKT